MFRHLEEAKELLEQCAHIDRHFMDRFCDLSNCCFWNIDSFDGVLGICHSATESLYSPEFTWIGFDSYESLRIAYLAGFKEATNTSRNLVERLQSVAHLIRVLLALCASVYGNWNSDERQEISENLIGIFQRKGLL